MQTTTNQITQTVTAAAHTQERAIAQLVSTAHAAADLIDAARAGSSSPVKAAFDRLQGSILAARQQVEDQRSELTGLLMGAIALFGVEAEDSEFTVEVLDLPIPPAIADRLSAPLPEPSSNGHHVTPPVTVPEPAATAPCDRCQKETGAVVHENGAETPRCLGCWGDPVAQTEELARTEEDMQAVVTDDRLAGLAEEMEAARQEEADQPADAENVTASHGGNGQAEEAKADPEPKAAKKAKGRGKRK